MVSTMENNLPNVDADEARSALAEVEAAQRAVRDTPWPTWLYPVNALLLGAYAVASLIEAWWRLPVWLGLAAGILALNIAAGMRMGTPWIVPTSRGFQVCVAVATLCMVSTVLLGPGHAMAVIALAATSTVTYLVGGVLHHRSTHR